MAVEVLNTVLKPAIDCTGEINSAAQNQPEKPAGTGTPEMQ